MLASAAGRLLEIIYFCRSSRLSSGIILPLNLGVLEPDCSMEALTESQCWVKRTAPGEGWGREVCWQFERHFKHSPDKFAEPVVSYAMPGPEWSKGEGGSCSKLIHITLLILFLNLYLSSWEAEGNSILEELCLSFCLNRMV